MFMEVLSTKFWKMKLLNSAKDKEKLCLCRSIWQPVQAVTIQRYIRQKPTYQWANFLLIKWQRLNHVYKSIVMDQNLL